MNNDLIVASSNTDDETTIKRLVENDLSTIKITDMATTIPSISINSANIQLLDTVNLGGMKLTDKIISETLIENINNNSIINSDILNQIKIAEIPLIKATDIVNIPIVTNTLSSAAMASQHIDKIFKSLPSSFSYNPFENISNKSAINIFEEFENYPKNNESNDHVKSMLINEDPKLEEIRHTVTVPFSSNYQKELNILREAIYLITTTLTISIIVDKDIGNIQRIINLVILLIEIRINNEIQNVIK